MRAKVGFLLKFKFGLFSMLLSFILVIINYFSVDRVVLDD